MGKQPFTTTFHVRVGDLNAGKHLGHVEFISLIHEARVRFINQLDPTFDELNFYGVGLLLKTLSADIQAQSYHGDELRVTVEVVAFSKVSFTLRYQAFNQTRGRLAGEFETQMVCVDYQSEKLKRVPADFKARFESSLMH